MRKLIVGILAHVDAGKTTLSEGLLYRSGRLRTPGRVDHKNAFLDTNELERERGITIFSKQAVLTVGELEITLVDTPGHADFSSEMERTLQVLDCAVLVVSGTDGVQGRTVVLWRLLQRYGIPTFLFVNKMDLAGADREGALGEIKGKLSDGCVDFSDRDRSEEHFMENVAMCDERALSRYLEKGVVTDQEIGALIAGRKLFPCYFGSALKLEGVSGFLEGLSRYGLCPDYPAEFGARVFKISRDAQGNRLTHMKITGGSLKVKSPLTNRRPELTEDEIWEEKADQIRVYSGAKFTAVDEAAAGTVCAVTGLSRTYPGEGFGGEEPLEPPALEPVLTYQVLMPPECDAHGALMKLRQLEEEDPQLRIVWNGQLREIHIQLMGEVQMEVLRRLILERFGLDVSFGAGSIVYRETIAAPAEGVGHFEPLRHYAEVHVLLEPGERGSGLRFDAACSEDILDRNWQRLILTHLEEKTHLGVLTGSPVTDMKITLVAGRAHEKHTEGGDFRQAAYRAVRQGLMTAKSVLLEPWYEFRLEVPAEYVGRAMADIQRMAGQVSQPESAGEEGVLTGSAPVSEMRDYAMEVTSYTRGRGRLFCSLKGYEPCRSQEEATAAVGYDRERDVENTADSVFCSHGAGFVVKWDQVREHMHVDSGLRFDEPGKETAAAAGARLSADGGSGGQDAELLAIFERTYGPIKQREPFCRGPEGADGAAAGRNSWIMKGAGTDAPEEPEPEYLIVDGYNVIFAWDELKDLARINLDASRECLMEILSNYQGFRKCIVIVVFDAYKVPHGTGEVGRYGDLCVVYTRQAETADTYIERAAWELGKHHRVRVVTSDGMVQLIILGHGALRVSARDFRREVEQVEGRISAILAQNNRKEKSPALREALSKAIEKPRDESRNIKK